MVKPQVSFVGSRCVSHCRAKSILGLIKYVCGFFSFHITEMSHVVLLESRLVKDKTGLSYMGKSISLLLVTWSHGFGHVILNIPVSTQYNEHSKNSTKIDPFRPHWVDTCYAIIINISRNYFGHPEWYAKSLRETLA